MQRRKFIRNTAASAVALPALINGLNMKAYGEGSMFHKMHTSTVNTDHVLVIIQMSGGNDGLNMVIPLDQYSNYYNARPNIAIAQSDVLGLTGTAATGLHPSMTGLRDMYNNGNVAIVQSAGYPTFNFSHFRATDIWMSASNSNEYISNGWLGRYLNSEFPGFPDGYPHNNQPNPMPDPLAIQFGSSTSLSLLGPTTQMSVTISDPNNFLNFINDVAEPLPGPYAGEKLAAVRRISKQAEVYSNIIKTAYNQTGNTNLVTYPATTLASQLKIVARLINGGLKTKVYAVNFSGFDTHAGQTDTANHSIGAHANLMAQLSGGIKAFYEDLKLMGEDQRVVGMTFSEFGRRIKSNASGGTDHGQAAPMFLFGTKVTGGIIGTSPALPTTATTSDNIAMQTDFRSIYQSILSNWLCQDAPSTLATMLRSFPQVPTVNNADCVPTPPGGRVNPASLITNYPNPATSYTTVEFKTDGGHTLMQLVGPDGNLISTIMEKTFDRPEKGTQRVDLSKLKMGMYYIRFQNGNKSQMKQILKVQ